MYDLVHIKCSKCEWFGDISGFNKPLGNCPDCGERTILDEEFQGLDAEWTVEFDLEELSEDEDPTTDNGDLQ